MEIPLEVGVGQRGEERRWVRRAEQYYRFIFMGRAKGFLREMPLDLLGDRNSSVGSAWARCPQRRRFDPPLGTFSGRGDFSLGVNMGSNSIPPKTPPDESINRGLVCAHIHFNARTQKILTFMS